MSAKKKPAKAKQSTQARRLRCGLCGKATKLTKTECYGTWVKVSHRVERGPVFVYDRTPRSMVGNA